MLQDNPSGVEAAFEQIVKGCHLAIHGATIMRQENIELQAANAKTTRKKQRTRKRIAHEGGITVLEALSMVSGLEIADKAGSAGEGGSSPTPTQPPQRARQRCSLCKNV
jgi:hypothetical protein